jgi:hypothetical protein
MYVFKPTSSFKTQRSRTVNETCCAWGGYIPVALWMAIYSAPRTQISISIIF